MRRLLLGPRLQAVDRRPCGPVWGEERFFPTGVLAVSRLHSLPPGVSAFGLFRAQGGNVGLKLIPSAAPLGREVSRPIGSEFTLV